MDNSNNNSIPAPASALTSELKQHPKYYIFLVTYLVLISTLGSFVNDMYTPALPAMCKFFGCSVSLAQMGLTTGMIGLAVGQLFMGPLSDRFGRLPLLYISLVIFIVAAVGSVFSGSIHVFNACRFFQGVGASGGYFLAKTIPADIYSGRSLARLMALIGAINGVAPASAPVIGGVTADHFGWKGVMLVLAGFALIVLITGMWMKESTSLVKRSKGHLFSAFKGYGTLIRRKHFMVHVAYKGLALGMLYAYISSSPFIIQHIYGFSQTKYGLLIGFNAIFVAIGSILALRFHPLKKAATVGCGVLMVGVIGQAICLMHVHSLIAFEVWAVIMMLGLGLIFSTTNTLAMNEGRDNAGDSSSLLGISGYLVGAIVSPIVGAGDILASTAIVYIVLMALITVAALGSRRIAPDLD